MDFELARTVSEIMHYAIVLILTGLFIIKSYKNFINFVLKFYIIFFIWGIVCFIFQGCPITLFENWISTKIYGQPFYPNYQFTDTDFYYMITNSDFYIPGVLMLVAILIKNKFNKDGSPTSSDNDGYAIGSTKAASYSNEI